MSAFYWSTRSKFRRNCLLLSTKIVEEMKGSSALANCVVPPVQEKSCCVFL